MKKILCVIAIIVLIPMLLCSCTIESNELKNRLVVQGIGIDLKDGELSLSIQALNTDVSSNPNSGDTPDEVVKIYEVSGKSLSEAVNTLTELTGKVPLLTQNRIIVFGSEVAQSGIISYLDYFLRSPDNRSTVVVAIAEDKANDIISADLGKNIIPARQTEKVIESSKLNGKTASVKVYELVNSIKDETKSAIAPVLTVEEKDDEKQMKIKSTALFREDKMVSEIDEQTTSGIVWLADDLQNGKYPFPDENGNMVTMNVIKSKTKFRTSIKDGKPFVDITVKCTLDCSEINDSVFTKKNLSDIEMMKVKFQESLQNTIEKSIDECIMKEKSDVFGFGKRLMRNEPSFFKANLTDWENSMSQLQYSITVDANVERIGDSAAVLYGEDI